eukprot:237063_1
MNIFYVTIIFIYHTLTSQAETQNVYFDDGSCEYVQNGIRFGGGNAGLFLKLGTSYPAVFVCRWQEPSGKWLRFRVNKAEGPFHRQDPISLFLGNSWQCEPGAKFTESSFGSNQKIHELAAGDVTAPAENIRVADALSNPSSNIGCFIAWCGRTRRACMANFNVEFYDQFAKGEPIRPVVFGLGWMDLLLATVLFFEIIAASTFVMSFLFKYNKVYQKLYGGTFRKHKKHKKHSSDNKPKSEKKSKKKKKKKSKSKRVNNMSEAYENDE